MQGKDPPQKGRILVFRLDARLSLAESYILCAGYGNSYGKHRGVFATCGCSNRQRIGSGDGRSSTSTRRSGYAAICHGRPIHSVYFLSIISVIFGATHGDGEVESAILLHVLISPTVSHSESHSINRSSSSGQGYFIVSAPMIK